MRRYFALGSIWSRKLDTIFLSNQIFFIQRYNSERKIHVAYFIIAILVMLSRHLPLEQYCNLEIALNLKGNV